MPISRLRCFYHSKALLKVGLSEKVVKIFETYLFKSSFLVKLLTSIKNLLSNEICLSYEITANLSRIFELYKNTVFCWKFSCFIFHSCCVRCLNVVFQFIKNSFFWNGDWKERILWQNMSFVRLQLAEWRSTFNIKVWVWKSRKSKIVIK